MESRPCSTVQTCWWYLCGSGRERSVSTCCSGCKSNILCVRMRLNAACLRLVSLVLWVKGPDVRPSIILSHADSPWGPLPCCRLSYGCLSWLTERRLQATEVPSGQRWKKHINRPNWSVREVNVRWSQWRDGSTCKDVECRVIRLPIRCKRIWRTCDEMWLSYHFSL